SWESNGSLETAISIPPRAVEVKDVPPPAPAQEPVPPSQATLAQAEDIPQGNDNPFAAQPSADQAGHTSAPTDPLSMTAPELEKGFGDNAGRGGVPQNATEPGATPAQENIEKGAARVQKTEAAAAPAAPVQPASFTPPQQSQPEPVKTAEPAKIEKPAVE